MSPRWPVSTWPTTRSTVWRTTASPFVLLESERRFSRDVRALERRAPMFLDVFDDEIIAGEMIHAGRALWIVHRVCHITHQDDVLAEIHLLTNRKRTTQH